MRMGIGMTTEGKGDVTGDSGDVTGESGVPSAGLYPDESGSKAKRKGALNAT